MKHITASLCIALIMAAGPAFSHTDTSKAEDQTLLAIPANAVNAVATVDRFNHAIAAGDIEKAGLELDEQVLILESGGAEHNAQEYLSNHAKEDAAFLKAAQIKLVRRTAQVSGDMAWVGSESKIQTQKAGKKILIVSTETMILKHVGEVWKIMHIHWSSHTKK